MSADRVNRIKAAADGRWRDILIGAGVPEALLAKTNRPCPLCGGTDRFTFFAKERGGGWFCRGCGHGDGIELLKQFRRENFPQTLAYLEQVLGLPPEEKSFERRKEVGEKKAAEASRLHRLEVCWNEAKPLNVLTDADPVFRYLKSRGLLFGQLNLSAELRSHPLLDYWEQGEGDSQVHERWPAMLARVTDAEGRLLSLHRTYLTPDGLKAPVAAQKKLASGTVEGGLVRLYRPGDVLGIAEGIETALAARKLWDIPVWSAISVSGFQNLTVLPDGVRKLVIFGDNDVSFVGQAGAYALAQRMRRDYSGLEIAVEIPRVAGCDWNDVWVRRSSGSRRPSPKNGLRGLKDQ